MNALVTGGGGFLGSAIVRMLHESGDEVSVLGRGTYPHIAAYIKRAFQPDIRLATAGPAAPHRTRDTVSRRNGRTLQPPESC
jgi:nucleoside-diphosphate-sugar epimerase